MIEIFGRDYLNVVGSIDYVIDTNLKVVTKRKIYKFIFVTLTIMDINKQTKIILGTTGALLLYCANGFYNVSHLTEIHNQMRNLRAPLEQVESEYKNLSGLEDCCLNEHGLQRLKDKEQERDAIKQEIAPEMKKLKEERSTRIAYLFLTKPGTYVIKSVVQKLQGN